MPIDYLTPYSIKFFYMPRGISPAAKKAGIAGKKKKPATYYKEVGNKNIGVSYLKTPDGREIQAGAKAKGYGVHVGAGYDRKVKGGGMDVSIATPKGIKGVSVDTKRGIKTFGVSNEERQKKLMNRVGKATQSPNFRMGTATPIGSHKSGGVLYDDGKVRNTNRSSHRKAVGTHKTGLPILNIFKKKKK